MSAPSAANTDPRAILVCVLILFTSFLVRTAQRNGSPAAASDKTTKPQDCFAIQLPLRTHTDGGQVQRELGG
jgi:hypothetical protein